MDGVLASPATAAPRRRARWHSLRERHPYRAALALGSGLGPLGLLCAFVAYKLAGFFLPPELWGSSAASGLASLGPAGMVFMAVVYAPLLETLLAQCLPIEIARRLGAGPLLCVLPSALLFGFGHYVNGGLLHGITSFCTGLVLASAYMALRRAGAGPACLAAASAHVVQNGMVMGIFLVQAAGAA